MPVATVYIIATIVGSILLLVEFIYGYVAWRDVKSYRAESTSLVKKRDAFQLFALIWITAACVTIFPVFFTYGQYGPGTDAVHQAVMFAIIGGSICIGLSLLMSRAATKFGILARQALETDRDIEGFLGDTHT
jgi:hypothetical protein